MSGARGSVIQAASDTGVNGELTLSSPIFSTEDAEAPGHNRAGNH